MHFRGGCVTHSDTLGQYPSDTCESRLLCASRVDVYTIICLLFLSVLSFFIFFPFFSVSVFFQHRTHKFICILKRIISFLERCVREYSHLWSPTLLYVMRKRYVRSVYVAYTFIYDCNLYKREIRLRSVFTRFVETHVRDKRECRGNEWRGEKRRREGLYRG